jgi:hypothetical protein
MASENDKDVVLVCDSMGGFIFSEFQNAFGARCMQATGKVVGMMSQAGLLLSRISREILSFEVLYRTIPCSWDKKYQTVRKKALEEAKNKK